jgi:hypothetical protein
VDRYLAEDLRDYCKNGRMQGAYLKSCQHSAAWIDWGVRANSWFWRYGRPAGKAREG